MSAIIDAGSSINLYMFHGGTNFGFINGAMHFNEYKSDVTSYGKYSSPATPTFECLELVTGSLSGMPSGLLFADKAPEEVEIYLDGHF